MIASLFLKPYNRYNFNQFSNKYVKSGTLKAPPPFNVTIMKGTRYVVLKRDFAQFIVTDQANN